MPFLIAQSTAGKKRKRASDNESKAGLGDEREDTKCKQQFILKLEAGIISSRQNYNDIVKLLSLAKTENDEAVSTAVKITLCRVFSVLMAVGSLTKSKNTPKEELIIVQWLKERYGEYQAILLSQLRSESQHQQQVALELLMRLVKAESIDMKHQGDSVWTFGLFGSILRTLVSHAIVDDAALHLFVETYFVKFDDIRFWTFKALEYLLARGEDDIDDLRVQVQPHLLKILLAVASPDDSAISSDRFYASAPDSKKHAVYSLSAHKKAAEIAWLSLLRSHIDKDHRKQILQNMTQRIVPWLINVEMVMDFLTDSYNIGGATSLLALSGLFHLMQERNLDYPSFYTKLYSLLDENLLHSKHRSRFFRLLDVFMSSSHLPAQLVASFIKRLSRLTLHAPPGGIVIVVPWIYNMLKTHPQCTFMIHREIVDPDEREELEKDGMDDPFDMGEDDPMQTKAIDSSLWEIETLQSHYHPNVATLAKIISEAFTKQSYNLEDFLDHSYDGLIETELGKSIKKSPVVEWEIPKRILTSEDGRGLNSFGMLLEQVREANSNTATV